MARAGVLLRRASRLGLELSVALSVGLIWMRLDERLADLELELAETRRELYRLAEHQRSLGRRARARRDPEPLLDARFGPPHPL